MIIHFGISYKFLLLVLAAKVHKGTRRKAAKAIFSTLPSILFKIFVNLAPVANSYYQYSKVIIVKVIYDSIISDSKAPKFFIAAF
jgi:hypothetical protein